jgi:peptidoglycan/xylan/chitin deacetylase (PgdA/CDA1 family)
MTRYTSGDAKWIPDWIPVTPNTAYIYRDYHKNTASTRIIAAFAPTTGSVTYQTLATLAPSSTWSTAAFTVRPPSGTAKIAVYNVLAAVGTLQLDDVSLALPQLPDMSSGVPNGSFEQADDLDLTKPLSWHTAAYGTNTPIFAYANGGHAGQRSAALTVSNYVSGDAKWYFDPQPIVPGTRYVYSDWYTATDTSFLTARLTMSDGTYQYISMGEVPATSSFAPAYGTFIAPPSSVAMTVFRGMARSGSLQFDDAAVSALSPPTLLQGVPNGDMEQAATPTVPVAWTPNRWGTNSTTFTYAKDGHSGTRSLRIDVSAYATGTASWYFDPQPVAGGQVFVVGDYYRSSVDTRPIAQLTWADGHQTYPQLPVAFASSDWALYTTELTIPSGVVSATLMHVIDSVGYLQIDDAEFALLNVQPFRRPLVSVTLDDAYASGYSNVAPILAAHGVPATYYVVTGDIGVSGRLSASNIQDLAAAGHEIASHTVTHPDLTTLSSTDLTYELSASRQALLDLGFGPTLDFASPLGSYNGTTLTAIEGIYASHRTVDLGYNYKNTLDPYRLKVQSMRGATATSDVLGWANQAAQTGGWLILVYHDVVPAPLPSDYAVTPDAFDAQLTTLQSAGLSFVTVQQALAEIASQ